MLGRARREEVRNLLAGLGNRVGLREMTQWVTSLT